MGLGSEYHYCVLCVDGDVCECGDDGMRQNTPEEGDRAGTSLGVIREGDENGFGDGKKWDGDDSLLENSRRGLSGKGHGQGGGAFDIGGGGGLGDGIDSGRRSRTGGESGRRSASGRVRVSLSAVSSREYSITVYILALTIFIAVHLCINTL